MSRSRGRTTRDKNKASLPQVPKDMKTDGHDIEFSLEAADHEDLEALARSQASHARVRAGQNQ